MSIAAIDPNSLRTQSNESKRGVGAADFSAAMSSVNPVATTVTSQATGQYQPAAVTQAAITGVSGAAGSLASNAPYYSPYGSSSVTPVSTMGIAGYPTPPIGGSPASGIPGISNPSQDFQEKQALFQRMNDANWEMLVAQVTINDLSRDYQARSNILKTKSDSELNAVRNMRA